MEKKSIDAATPRPKKHLVGQDILSRPQFDQTSRHLEEGQSPKRKKHRWFWVVIIVAVGLTSLGAGGYFYINPKIQGIARAANEGRDTLNQAQKTFLEKNDFKQAKEELEIAQEKFAQAHRQLFALGYLEKWPVAGKQYQALDQLLLTTDGAIDSLQQVVTLAEDIFGPIFSDPDRRFNDITPDEKKTVLANLQKSLPKFDQIKQALAAIDQDISGISTAGLFPQVKEAVTAAQAIFPHLHSIMEKGEIVARIGPTLAGYPSSNKVLILFQNNWELRPTGGFIGSLATAKVEEGELHDFRGIDVYSLDIPAIENRIVMEESPWPIKEYLGQQYWFLRDSNFSPDFRTSAQKAIYFYRVEGGQPPDIDSVIAFNPNLIAQFIEKTGDITLEGYPYTFTPDNFTEVLEEHVGKKYAEMGISEEHRKDIMIYFQAKLLSRFFDLSKNEIIEIARVVLDSLETKDMLIYSQDEKTEKVLVDQNWAGTIRATAGDFAAIFDSNMGSLKTDKCIERFLRYELDAGTDDDVIAKMTMKYKHTCPHSFFTTQYKTYTRLYVPAGSTLMDTDGVASDFEVKTYEEFGKTVFDGLFITEPETETSWSYTYKLPEKTAAMIRRGEYSLIFQKQPGSQDPKLQIILDFSEEVGEEDGPSEPRFSPTGNKILYSSDLHLDREFKINLKQD